jgi:ABC-2 type transport system permease protein
VFAPGVALMLTGATIAGAPAASGGAPAFAAKLAIDLVGSVLIVLSARFAIGASAFWAPRGAEEISTRAGSLFTLTDFPFDPLPAPMRAVLLSVLPAGFVTWFPVGSLLGRRGDLAWMATPIVAVVTVTLATLVFRKGLRHYERTGSQRYSSFGHRR